MGQYYTPVLLKGSKGNIIDVHFCSHDYDNGLKLMEHSYIGNDFVGAVLRRLNPHPTTSLGRGRRLVWAGDYADVEPGSEDNLNNRAESTRRVSPPHPTPDCSNDRDLYRYLVNLTKEEFVDCHKCTPEDASPDSLIIHPLPLLTAEGNGQGGGDYRGSNEFLCGTWSRDRITACSTPLGYIRFFRELTPKFTEA